MRRDLSVTALYTSQAWVWGDLSCADLLASRDGKQVFDVTNLALGLRRLVRPRLPSLPHSLVQRHRMIDHMLHAFGPCRVVELGAGLSRRGVAFSADPGFEYVEVDLPPVLARKRELLARSVDGQRALARENYRLVPGHVETCDLEALAGADRPLFIVAEGLFMYLVADAQRALWRRLTALTRRASRGALVFDLVPAVEELRPGLFGRLLGRSMRTFTGGLAFVRDERVRDDIRRELLEAGFSRVDMFEHRAVGAEWGLPFLDRNTQQLVFQAI